jgi:hypothetical protein
VPSAVTTPARVIRSMASPTTVTFGCFRAQAHTPLSRSIRLPYGG